EVSCSKQASRLILSNGFGGDRRVEDRSEVLSLIEVAGGHPVELVVDDGLRIAESRCRKLRSGLGVDHSMGWRSELTFELALVVDLFPQRELGGSAAVRFPEIHDSAPPLGESLVRPLDVFLF